MDEHRGEERHSDLDLILDDVEAEEDFADSDPESVLFDVDEEFVSDDRDNHASGSAGYAGESRLSEGKKDIEDLAYEIFQEDSTSRTECWRDEGALARIEESERKRARAAERKRARAQAELERTDPEQYARLQRLAAERQRMLEEVKRKKREIDSERENRRLLRIEASLSFRLKAFVRGTFSLIKPTIVLGNAWKLLPLLLPKKLRNRIFDPAHQELLEEYLLRKSGRGKWHRAWLGFCFTFCTALMVADCFRTVVVDQGRRFVRRIVPSRVMWWWVYRR